MNVLLVYAHPEPGSFNGAMRDTAVRVLTGAGHAVVVSDLHAMRFDPVGGPHDFTDLQDAGFFRYQREQRHAAATGTFAPELQAEIEKVRRADLLLLQFPLWWYSLPAILKGWIDRVFAMGFAYDAGRTFDNGPLAGRRAMVAVTTGGLESSFADGALNPRINEILFHIHYGMFRLTGMKVLPPFVAHGAVRISDEQRSALLSLYSERLRAIEHAEPLVFPSRVPPVRVP
jgi:NAD(P)H dehydrogenase (quinone)